MARRGRGEERRSEERRGGARRGGARSGRGECAYACGVELFDEPKPALSLNPSLALCLNVRQRSRAHRIA